MNRWQKAQVNEKYFWKNRRKLKPLARPEYEKYIKFIGQYLQINKKTKIIEIGCGPQTLVEEMVGELYGLDPLMDYFLSEYEMDKNVEWKQGTGEAMPYPNGFFDLIIIGNVLDHCSNPTKVLQESYRCLKSGGLLFLVQNCYSKPLVLFKTFMEKIGLGDTCHPYAFTIRDIFRVFKNTGFNILAERQHFILNFSQEKDPAFKKIKRLIRDKGRGYVLKHSIIKILSYLPEHIFKTYSLHIFLARKK